MENIEPEPDLAETLCNPLLHEALMLYLSVQSISKNVFPQFDLCKRKSKEKNVIELIKIFVN